MIELTNRPGKDVIILGSGPTNIECGYHCEVFGVNGTYTFAKRLDKLFFTDEETEVKQAWYDIPKIMSLDCTCVFPIEYKRFSDLGLKIEIFPMEKIMDAFPTRFYSNTIAYMLAYALYKGYERIWFYGIDMMTNTCYVQEKGGVEYWMGVVLGMSHERVKRGLPPIELINTDGSATGKTWNGIMYGYYGEQELLEQKNKEKLYIPFEMARTSKEGKADWTLSVNDGEYHRKEADKKGEYDLEKELVK